MATSASGIYSETLQSIIDAKLAELERKRSVFDRSSTTLRTNVASQSDAASRLKTLVEGVKTSFGIASTNDGRIINGSSKHSALEEKLANLERFLDQLQYDPSISARLLAEWEKALEQQLQVQSSRFEYASLYAQLVTEWLTAEKKVVTKPATDPDLMMSGFEEVESKQAMEARAKWSATVFEARQTDAAAIMNNLEGSFRSVGDINKPLKPLQALRARVADFERDIVRPEQFNEDVLRWVIKGLLKTDLLAEDKRNVLRDFLTNDIILDELADVLNLRLSSIDNWSWGEWVQLEQKRNIQGQFQIVMHEDLLQAIFLQFIGVKWSVFLKDALSEFVTSEGAWLPSAEPVPREHRKRCEYYLGPQYNHLSLQATRDALWRKSYFMCQLPSSEGQDQGDSEEGEVEADISVQQGPQMQQMMQMAVQAPGAGHPAPKKRMALHAARRAVAPPDIEDQNLSGVTTPTNPTQAKQSLLHILSTEILINTSLHGDLTAFRGQFERWNPLLPHTTILAVMKHLGVSARWLRLFKAFLEAPLRFKDEDTTHIRRRGVPGSHALSDVLGEAVLFCLDVVVNRATNGGRLWRVHDDFWFWSVNHSTSVHAWKTIHSFSNMMGLTLDLTKSGSVRVGNQAGHIDPGLPQTGIRWGFLSLHSASGRFEIDQAMVSRHIEELRRQLDAKNESVFSWIEVWNAYASTFFTTNFGKPANCFGRAHIDAVLATLKIAQEKLLEMEGGISSVVQHLRAVLSDRFAVQDMPEGFVFFPSALGGLELRNPFVIPLQLRDSVTKEPSKLMIQFADNERDDYNRAKKRFVTGNIPRNGLESPDYNASDAKTFFSFEDYTRYREQLELSGSQSLRYVFVQLMQRPDEQSLTATAEITSALSLIDTGGVVGQPGKCGINGDWYGMEPYWKWILVLHGPEILKRFGGLNIVDNGVLPIGMVSLFRSKGISWKG